ncbi:MAG: hypothetical protein LBB08_01480 [Rickettsiales bacterium]|jgi:hypothetical protein|nr:hypothetical protein [Rickettsiales bacterium]
MRKERLLLSVLWLCAFSLAGVWFLDLAWGFNPAFRSHWRYLAELQVTGAVDMWFYASLGALPAAFLAGLYILIVPWHRKIRPAQRAAEHMRATVEEPAPPTGFARPPSLNLNSFFPKNAPAELSVQSARDRSEYSSDRSIADGVRQMMSSAGFLVKPAPRAGGIKLDFWGLGTDETLLAGILAGDGGEISAFEGAGAKWRSGSKSFDSPAWAMTGAAQKLSSLFSEVLNPELKIHIFPFVFAAGRISNKDGAARIWDALGVNVFDDINELGEFFKSHRPRPLEGAEREDFAAFADFMDTAAAHVDKGGS